MCYVKEGTHATVSAYYLTLGTLPLEHGGKLQVQKRKENMNIVKYVIHCSKNLFDSGIYIYLHTSKHLLNVH